MPLLLLLAVLFFICPPCQGASMVAADEHEGYGDKVLSRLLTVWAPPPNLKGNFNLKIKIAVDSDGKLKDCAVTKGSGMDTLDVSACGAARQVSKFDAPPGGRSGVVYISFWTGLPKGNTKETPPDPMAVLRAEMLERDNLERNTGKQRADATEERARDKAEQAAKRTGKILPDVQPHPVNPPNMRPVPAPKVNRDAVFQRPKQADAPKPTQAPNQQAGKQIDTQKAAQTPDRDSAAVSAPFSGGLTEEEMNLVMEHRETDSRSDSPSISAHMQTASPASSVPPTVQPQPKPAPPAVQSVKQYISKARWQLNEGIIVPAETAPGSYSATVRISIRPDGSLEKYELISPTGDALLDKYVLRSLRKAGSLPPPPANCPNPVDFTFKLRRL